MPPPSSSNKAKPQPRPSSSVPPRSRNTTPLPPSASGGRPSTEPAMPSYLKAPLRTLSKECDTIEEVLGRASLPSHIPTGQTLNNLRESVQKRCLDHVKLRGDESDILLRELQNLRKTHMVTRRERADRPDKSPKKDPDSKIKLKKVKKREPDEHRPPAVGAHGMARQDGVDVHKGGL